MDVFYERLIVRAATIDELLSDAFETLPGQKRDADLAARRLAAWCRSCASGDWSLFSRRLERDRLSIGQVLAKFATVRRSTCAATPRWIDDAIWIEAALLRPRKDVDAVAALSQAKPCAFEHLFAPVIDQAEALLRAGIDGRAFDDQSEAARACLRHSLLKQLCSLSAPVLYDRFVKAMKSGVKPAHSAEPDRDGSTSQYDRFVAEMKIAGFRRLFDLRDLASRRLMTVLETAVSTGGYRWNAGKRQFNLGLFRGLAGAGYTFLRQVDRSLPNVLIWE